MRSLLAGISGIALVSCAIAPAIALAVAPALAAQQPQSQQTNPISTALKSEMQRAQRNLIAAARTMPASKYSFRPTAAQMTFGQLVLHVTGSNEHMCSMIAGTPDPKRASIAPTAPKDSLVARIEQSFEYCSQRLAPMDDSKIADVVPYFGGRKISRGGAMLALVSDWADHYGAAAIYLRLNGILPPSAKGNEPEM